jgi:hypothetical protein
MRLSTSINAEIFARRCLSSSSLAFTAHQLNTLIRYQQAIDAIDRLIEEEQRAAEIAAGVQPRIKYED